MANTSQPWCIPMWQYLLPWNWKKWHISWLQTDLCLLLGDQVTQNSSFSMCVTEHEGVSWGAFWPRGFTGPIILLLILILWFCRNSCSLFKSFWSNMQSIHNSQQETQYAFACALWGWCNFSINLNKCCCIFRPCNYPTSAGWPLWKCTGERLEPYAPLLIKLWNPSPRMWWLMKYLLIIWSDPTCWGKLF